MRVLIVERSIALHSSAVQVDGECQREERDSVEKVKKENELERFVWQKNIDRKIRMWWIRSSRG